MRDSLVKNATFPTWKSRNLPSLFGTRQFPDSSVTFPDIAFYPLSLLGQRDVCKRALQNSSKCHQKTPQFWRFQASFGSKQKLCNHTFAKIIRHYVWKFVKWEKRNLHHVIWRKKSDGNWFWRQKNTTKIMDLQILISILWLSCSVQGQQDPDVIITSSEPSIGKVLK